MANAETLPMMMTALMIFLGLSTSATLFIVASVVLGARRTLTAESITDLDPAREMRASSATFAPAFSH